jgi:hypothetical protein
MSKNEEIKHYSVNDIWLNSLKTGEPVRHIALGSVCLSSSVHPLESDITLMIEQMGKMKDTNRAAYQGEGTF